MAIRSLPPQSVLNQLLRYDAETGKLFWRARSPSFFKDGKQTAIHNAAIWNSKNAGREAFTTSLPSGHRYSSIKRTKMFAHRVIWKMVTGDEPGVIDHISGDPSDNRMVNLRSVSQVENGQNQRLRKNNASGVMGISWDPRRSKWYARINVDYGARFLGYFDQFDDAVAARRAAEIEHNFHQNHGRSSTID